MVPFWARITHQLKSVAVLLGTSVMSLGLVTFASLSAHADASQSVKKHRVLILYATVGNGHLSATKAIVDEYRKIDPNAEIYIKDVLDFQSNFRRKLVYNILYDLATRYTPKQYDKWYESKLREAEAIDSLGNMSYVDGLRPDRYLQYIKKVDPTVIVSTQNRITDVMHRLRDQGELSNIPIAQVMTDYTPTTQFRRLSERIEMTFVPHQAIERQFVADGLPASKVTTTGIPVSPKTFEPISIADRSVFLQSQNLDPKKPVILISSGSAGVGNYQAMVESIAAHIKEPVQIVAVTGRSESNRKSLENMIQRKSLPSNIHLKVLPLIPQDQMLKYLKASEVIVGKSGGLTTTEIVALGKKAVLLDINGGQESYNSRFFAENHLSLMTKDLKQIGPLTERLLHDKKLEEQIKSAQSEMRTQIRPNVIAQWITRQRAIPLSRSSPLSLKFNKSEISSACLIKELTRELDTFRSIRSYLQGH